jgi:nucleolar GTP-binding protein
MRCSASQLTLLRRLSSIFPHETTSNYARLAGIPTSQTLISRCGGVNISRRSMAAAAGGLSGETPAPLSPEDVEEDMVEDLPPSNNGMFTPEQLSMYPPDPTPPPPPPRAVSTGAFQRLPMVSPSREIIESAVRRAERVGGNKKLKNEAARAKNRAARQLDGLMKELAAPLGTYERGFPRRSRLHPFENALLELTVGSASYDRAVTRVTALRKASVEVAKGYAARAGKAANKRDALALQAEGFARVEAIFNRGADAVDELKELAKSLRRLPVVDPRLPTVALVGAPNVGKSSLVQLLSSGLPEVQNYPFTTRSIKMGHFYVDGRRHQVTDTPGLLRRPDEDRNAMERLTLASLQYLPTAVLFVADLTGECGTSVADQWAIRAELRERFEGKPWLDVLSKADLLEEEFDEADNRNRANNADNNSSSSNTNRELGVVINDAIDFAAAVPNAQRVSSLTGNGIDVLKESMLNMLEEYDLNSQGLEAWGDDDEEDGEMEDGEEEIGGVPYSGPPILMT